MEDIHMLNYNESALSISKPTLPLSGLRAYTFQVFLISGVVILPWIAHLSGAPVRYLLPMHWFVILSGLVYGWRSGALIGFLAPVVNYIFSGFPLPIILPSMTLELFTYGLIVGILREQIKLNPLLSVIIALVAGRTIFIMSILLGNLYATNRMEYFQAALIPGIVAAICQIALLPLVAKWWIKKEQHYTNSKTRTIE
jgi:LytS/YehU family sensor histidine kinase